MASLTIDSVSGDFFEPPSCCRRMSSVGYRYCNRLSSTGWRGVLCVALVAMETIPDAMSSVSVDSVDKTNI